MDYLEKTNLNNVPEELGIQQLPCQHHRILTECMVKHSDPAAFNAHVLCHAGFYKLFFQTPAPGNKRRRTSNLSWIRRGLFPVMFHLMTLCSCGKNHCLRDKLRVAVNTKRLMKYMISGSLVGTGKA